MRTATVAVALAGALALVPLAGCAERTAGHGDGPSAPPSAGSVPDDFAVDYSFTNGSLPPPDHYSYTITIDSSGAGTYTYVTGYEDDTADPTPFEANDDQLRDLYQAFADAGVFEAAPGLSALPVGGANRHLTVTADGHQYDWDSGFAGDTTPVDDVYEDIEALAPR